MSAFWLELTLSNVCVSAALALVLLFSIVTAFATRELPPQRLRDFGQSLCSYSYSILRYIAFVERRPPFPFSDWPTAAGQ